MRRGKREDFVAFRFNLRREFRWYLAVVRDIYKRGG